MIDDLINQLRENDKLLTQEGEARIGAPSPDQKLPPAPPPDQKIDLHHPRTALVANGAKAGLPCPDCQTPVIEQDPVYLAGLIDKRGSVIDQFYLNAPIGLFCPDCATTLIDLQRTETLIKFNNPEVEEKLAQGCKATVLGLIVETNAKKNQTKVIPFNSAAPAPTKKKKSPKTKRKPKVKKKTRK